MLIGIGLILGITTVVPGVSAGTIAVAFNVYDRLIAVITPNVKKVLAAWRFLVPLALGGLAGIYLFSSLLSLLLANYRLPTIWFFAGIVAGSIPLIYRRLRGPSSAAPSPIAAVCGIAAFALMVLMAVFHPAEDMPLYTALTPPVVGLLFAGGVLAAIAMIIPGTSGSFMLLVVGLYRTVVQAVADRNFLLIAPFVLGTVAGLLLGSALVRYLLAKAPRETYGAVLGLVAGSLVVLYPGGLGSGAAAAFSVVSALAGFAVSFAFGRRKNKEA